MFFRNQVVNPEVCVAFLDKVMETPEAISVRPMTFHPFPGCFSAIGPALITGALLAFGTWIIGGSWSLPLEGAGYVFVFFYIHYHFWNFRRKRSAHNLVIDKVHRRIHLRDLKSRKRVTFPFDHVESITDRHDEVLGGNKREFIRFTLCDEWIVDNNPPVSHFKKENAQPMYLWKRLRIKSSRFGDLLAEIIGCPITHEENTK